MPAHTAAGRRSTATISSFAEFWPFYVREHSNSLNRTLHFIGTATIAPLLVAAVLFDVLFLLLIPVSAYGFAWFGHFVIEKNRPATFSYPWWSLLGDFKMFGCMLSGRMGDEVRRCHALV
jgi:hypothetical protein